MGVMDRRESRQDEAIERARAYSDAAPGAMRRAGLLIPSSNTTVEVEYNRFGPAELGWHVGRVAFTDLSPEGLAAQDPQLTAEAAKLATAHPEIVFVAQSATGFVRGAGYERGLAARLRPLAGCPVLSAAEAMVAAVRALGVGRIGLAMPFASGIDTLVEGYFAAAGITPARSATLGMTGNFAIAAVPAARLVELARAVDGPDVEAIVIPGGNLRAMAAVEAIEAALGKPVVITNQVGIWAVCGALGIGCGATLPGLLARADPDGAIRRRLVWDSSCQIDGIGQF